MKMITEDYVSFEIAKLLKEKGFNELTYACFSNDGKETYYGYRAVGDDINRPTLQMATKWLREVCNIHIHLDIHWLYFANQKGWIYTIERILENGVEYVDSKGDENDKMFYLTYEEACESAIKYCFENLI